MTRSTTATPAIFSSAPDTRFYQPIGSIERCREQLESMLRTDAGLGVVIGPPGTGKSLLCQKLAESLRDVFDVVLLAETAPRDQVSLLQNILFHLNLPYKNLAEGELRLALIDRLTQNVLSREGGLVLIVDEAQSLPDCILEEIRMITNIVRGGRSCVRTVLAGNQALEDRVSQANMESLAQRIAVRCYLHPFSQADTARYVRAAVAGLANPPAIDDAATAAIHFATGGVTRLIHQMMRQVLATKPGEAIGEVIGVDLINQAWSHSRQLASPVVEPAQRDPTQRDPTQGVASEPAQQAAVQVAEKKAAQDIVEYGPLSACPTEEQLIAPESDPPQQVDDHPEHGPATDALAESMPEVAADLDRVTDSLLRIAAQDYDESEGVSEQTLFAEATGGASCDVTIIDASVQWNLETPADGGCCRDSAAEPFGQSSQLIEPSALFGDGFEEEETICCGPVRLAVGHDDDCEEERQLQRDVADISEEAASIQLLCDDASEILELPPVAAIGTDGVGSGRRLRSDDIFLTDDSDMLIIEEIVDVEPAAVRSVAFDDDPSDSVDYQLLLNRMRQV